MSTFQVAIIPSGHVRNVLVEILPMLDKAAAVTNGRMTTDDIVAEIMNGTVTLWIAFDTAQNNKIFGVLLSKMVNYYRRRMMSVTFSAGERASDWMDLMIDRLFSFSKEQGCDAVEWTGRRGWERFLNRYGLKVKYCLFELDIDNARAEFKKAA